ncbi:phage tail family protein [Glutamicibacter endophyticus]|nr:phage tail domain-containing protein [Glutamicibacter sp. PS]MDR4533207.1 phage tail family protein [Glutamicibacter sp. PS]
MVMLDGFPLTGVTRDGVWKRLGDIEGWWTRPAAKTQYVDRPRGDGQHPSPVRFGERLITINGRVTSRNHDYLHQAQQQINALGLRGGAKLMVSGHGPAQWALVDPRGETSADFATDTYLSWQIPLVASDPFKYGEPQAFSFHTASASSVPVFHRGTVPAWPVVTVTGYSASQGYTLTLNGKSIVVTQAAWSSQPHVLDYRTGILRVGGSVARGGISTANYSPVKPGMPQSLSISVPAGTAKVDISFYDTFI